VRKVDRGANHRRVRMSIRKENIRKKRKSGKKREGEQQARPIRWAQNVKREMRKRRKSLSKQKNQEKIKERGKVLSTFQ